MIWLAKFPLPPSANERLMWGKQGRMIKSQKARTYDQLIQFYKLQHQVKCLHLGNLLKQYIAKGSVLGVEAYFVFQPNGIVSTEGKPIANDADNRLKSCIDGLVKVLGIDDKYFFQLRGEKVINTTEAEECAMVRIYPVQIRTSHHIRTLMTEETLVASSLSKPRQET